LFQLSGPLGRDGGRICGLGVEPFTPTVQRRTEPAEPETYAATQQRSEDRQHDLHPNGHAVSIAQTSASESPAQALEDGGLCDNGACVT
jgi:hypothetical protein